MADEEENEWFTTGAETLTRNEKKNGSFRHRNLASKGCKNQTFLQVLSERLLKTNMANLRHPTKTQ